MTTPYARNDLLVGGSLGWAEAVRAVTHIDWTYGFDNSHIDSVAAEDRPMRLTGITFSTSGEAFFSHDDPTQSSDYAPHDVVYLSRNPNTNQPGLAALVARLDSTLELWTYTLAGAIVHKYTGITTDPTWKRDGSRIPSEIIPYTRLDVLCDSKTVYYTDMGHTIFQYDLTGAGTQLTPFVQLDTDNPFIYAAIRILKPSGRVLVAMTASGHGPRNALALNQDRVTFWADEINPPDGLYDLSERSLTNGAVVVDASIPPVDITYRVRLDPSDINDEVFSLATWFSPCAQLVARAQIL